MSLSINKTPRSLPESIPMSSPDILATLWEHQELRERLDKLELIAEHIDLENTDLSIIAWQQFVALLDDLYDRQSKNLASARNNAKRLGHVFPVGGKAFDDQGFDDLASLLSTLDITGQTSYPDARVHPAQHLACNIGVVRAGTVVQAAHGIMKVTHATSPVAGVIEFVSRISRHMQALDAQLLMHESDLLTKLEEQGHDIRGVTLVPEFFSRRLRAPYWKVVTHTGTP